MLTRAWAVQLSNAASITSVLPATLVTALVTATLPSGLNVKFFGYFDGTIDKFHLNGLDPEKNFKLGQKIKARVLWDSIASTPKKFSLSISKHVVDMDIAKVKDRGVSVADLYPVGRSLAQVKIIHIDDEWGLTCEITEDDVEVAAFVHVSLGTPFSSAQPTAHHFRPQISRVTDDHLASVPKSGPWKVGSTHRARVVGYSAVDALVQLSFQPSVLDQAFLRVQDVRVGEIIKVCGFAQRHFKRLVVSALTRRYSCRGLLSVSAILPSSSQSQATLTALCGRCTIRISSSSIPRRSSRSELLSKQE